jgi:hypothetical protein
VHNGVWCTHLIEIFHLEELSIDKIMILKRTFKTVDMGVDLIDLDQHTAK